MLTESNRNCSSDLVGVTLELMERGDSEIELTNNTEAVMVIGTTGQGKSTLTYFIAGNNTKLISYPHNALQKYIKDCNQKIGTNSTISATIFPNLVTHLETNTAYYDNPGFDDTRTDCVEIANSYFMNKVVKDLERVKFVLVIGFDHFTGASRDGLKKLLASAATLIPNTEHYSRAFSLIGTKALFPADPEEALISVMLEFLEGTKADLESSEGDEKVIEKSIQILDALMGSGGANLGVFRVPTECGFLSEMEYMQNNRLTATEAITTHSEFVDIVGKFGTIVKAETKIKVKEIGQTLGNDVEQLMYGFADVLKDGANFDCIGQLNCELLLSQLYVLYSNVDFMDRYDSDVWPTLNFVETVQRLINAEYIPPGVTFPDKMLESLANNSRYMDFLHSVADLGVSTSRWLEPMKVLSTYIQVNSNQIYLRMNETIFNDLTAFATAIQNSLNFSCVTYGNQHCENVLTDLITLYNNSDFRNRYSDTSFWSEINETGAIARLVNSDYWPKTALISDELLLRLEFVGLYLQTLANTIQLRFDKLPWLHPMKQLENEVDQSTQNLIVAMKANIATILESLKLDLIESRVPEFELFNEIYEKREKLILYKGAIALEMDFTVEGMLLTSYIELILSSFPRLGLSQDSIHIQALQKEKQYLQSLEIISGTEIVIRKAEDNYDWLRPFTGLAEAVAVEIYWCQFLIELYEEISDITVQTGSRITDLRDWTERHDITEDTFLQFLIVFKELQPIDSRPRDDILNCLTFSPLFMSTKLASVQLLLDSTVPAFTCVVQGTAFNCSGNYVTLSAVFGQLPNTTTTLIVSAFQKLFIQNDIYRNGSPINVTIIATNITAHGTARLDLSGAKGESYSGSGRPGLPGNVGQNGCNLHLVGQYIEEGKLHVVLNGGNAGDGQPGIDGTNGQDGARKDFDPDRFSHCEANSGDVKVKITPYKCCQFGQEVQYSAKECNAGNSGCWHEILGEEGTYAGSGANGGCQGYPGNPGIIFITNLETSLITNQTRLGLSGADGRGGIAGRGGRRGDYWRGFIDDLDNRGGNTTAKYCGLHGNPAYYTSSEKKPDGSAGQAGAHCVGRAQPMPNYFAYSDITRYKDAFKWRANSIVNNEYLRKTLSVFLSNI